MIGGGSAFLTGARGLKDDRTQKDPIREREDGTALGGVF